MAHIDTGRLEQIARGQSPSGEESAHLSGCDRCSRSLERHTPPGLLSDTLQRPPAAAPASSHGDTWPPHDPPPTEVLSDPGVEPVRIGRYWIRGRLGAGGMSVVYTGYDPELDREVAIKLIRPELKGEQAQ